MRVDNFMKPTDSSLFESSTHQVAWTRSVLPFDVIGIVKFARLQRQTPAADAPIKRVAQRFECFDPCVNVVAEGF